MRFSPLLRARWITALLLPLATFTCRAAVVVTQAASDGSTGDSSFTLGAHWDDGLAPHSGADYVSSLTIRTPASSGSQTFGGDSLTLNSGGTLTFKGTGTTPPTITVHNLTLNTGSTVTSQVGRPFTLAGNIILNAGNIGTFQVTTPTNFGFSISATIAGEGALRFTTSYTSQTDSDRAVTLRASNTFSGGSTINTFTSVIAASDGAFGTGNVTMNGGNLTFQSGLLNDYIASTGKFILSSTIANFSINLNFSGIDDIGGLSLDGGTTYLSPHTYSVTELNTLYGSEVFVGTGQLNVVPEPGAIGPVTVAAALLLLGRFRRKSSGFFAA